jgi:hypothetical protein
MELASAAGARRGYGPGAGAGARDAHLGRDRRRGDGAAEGGQGGSVTSAARRSCLSVSGPVSLPPNSLCFHWQQFNVTQLFALQGGVAN